ncbi:MAG: SbcC/MukB-like Walker B domain-containing protein [Pseudomonadota bacterium]
MLTNDWVDIKPFQDFLEPAQKTQIEHQKLWQFLFEHPGEVGVNTKPPIDKLRRLRDQKQETAAQLQRQRKQFDVEIERLESNHKVRYPHAVNEAIAAITKMVKGSKPRVLCDFVEVNDERWQTAIEGYLGGNRFAIIVEPEHEAQAIKVVRNLKGKNTSKVIQTAKAKQDAERFSLSEDSIIHVMEFTHAAIKDFVIASYGNVSRVETTEELRQTRRGVTPEAIGSGNYAMFRCDVDDADLVFGKAARIRSLVAKKEGIDNCLIELHQTQEQFQNLVEIVQHLEAFHSLKIANEVNLLLDYYRETQAIQTQINDLDLSRFEDLEKTITDVQEKQGEIREHIDKHLKTHGQLETQLKDSERKKSNFSKEQDNLALEVEKSEENIDATTKVWNHVDADDLINQAKVFAKKVNIKKLEENDVKTAFEAISKNRYSLINALREHNQISNSSEAIPITLDVGDLPNHQQFTKICKIQLGIDSTLILLKANKLVEKQDSISKLKKTFDNTFVDHLCGVIHQAVKEGERVLEDLNEELKRHQFGQEKETYRFHWEFMPDFKEYWDFFEEVRQFPIGDGTTLFDLKLSKKSKQVRDKLLNMLLDDDDEARAIRELERLADYRNYRHYEIYKEVPGKEPIALSQYGTGSGGQLETPAYIIRAAAITSALQYNQPGAHLRTVLVDEAFSKMDEARSRSVINYLTQSLGLQVIFIMPSKASGPFLDMISHQFVFAKYPLAAGQTNGQLKTAVFVDRKESHQDKVQALWAQHKETIYEQASLDFMEELFKEEADVLNKSSK